MGAGRGQGGGHRQAVPCQVPGQGGGCGCSSWRAEHPASSWGVHLGRALASAPWLPTSPVRGGGRAGHPPTAEMRPWHPRFLGWSRNKPSLRPGLCSSAPGMPLGASGEGGISVLGAHQPQARGGGGSCWSGWQRGIQGKWEEGLGGSLLHKGGEPHCSQPPAPLRGHGHKCRESASTAATQGARIIVQGPQGAEP